MAINDPQVTSWIARLRADMEDLDRLQTLVRETKTRYDSVISQLPAWTAAARGDLIEDGRSAEGVSRLTKADAIDAMAQIYALVAQMNGAGVLDTVRKPTVRPMRTR